MDQAFFNGGALIVVGVLLLLNQMDIVAFGLWALLFFVVGLLKILHSTDASGRLWGALLVAAGVVFELEHLGYVTVHLDTTWPAFVIAAGLILIWRAYQRPASGRGELFQHLNVFAVCGEEKYRIDAKNFRGGDVVAFMGGFDIDLRDADIEASEATMNVNTLMGRGVIRVPEAWTVSMVASVVMGGHNLKTRESPQPTKTLVVKGLTIMGWVKIKN
jgi:predicted membrane protein